MAALRTWFDIIGRDQASPAMAKVSGSMRTMGATARSTGQAMARAFAPTILGAGLIKLGSGIQGVVKAAVGEARELQYSIAELRGISGATGAELDQLTAKARQLGIETQFTPTQAIEGLTALAQQGFTAGQQLGSVQSALLLAGASGGRVPLADAAKLTAQTLKAFQLDASQAGITVDTLTKTTTMSGLAIDELAEALQNASSGAIAMGLDVRESMAALGLIKNIIPSASMAGSAFQIMTQRLSDPRVQKLLSSGVGVEIVDQATGKYRDFGRVLVELSEGMMGLSEAERGAIIGEAFGARAKKGILSIMAQLHAGVTTTTGAVLTGQKAWDYWMAALDEKQVAGFAKELNDLKLDTLNGQLQLLTGSIQTFLGELGKSTEGILKSGIKAFLAIFNRMLEVFQALPGPVKTVITAFAATFGTVIKLVGGLMLAKGVFSLLGVSITGLLASLGKMILIAGPLTLVLGALGVGVYGIFRALKNNIAGAGTTWADLMGKIKLGWRGVVDLVSHGALSKEVMADLQKAENRGVARFLKNAMVWIEKAKKFFKGLVSGFDDGLRRLAGPIADIKNSIAELFGGWFRAGDAGRKAIDKWYTRGESFGKMLSRFSALILKGVNLLIRFAGWAKEAFGTMTVEGFVTALVSAKATLDSTLSVMGKIADAALRALDFQTAAATIGKSTEDLTRGEMLARVGYLHGEDKRGQLAERFELYDRLRKVGGFGKGAVGEKMHRQQMEAAYTRMGREDSESWLMFMPKIEGREEAYTESTELGYLNLKSIPDLRRAIEKMTRSFELTRRTEIVMDTRTVGEVIEASRTEAEAEGYYVPISPAARPVAAED